MKPSHLARHRRDQRGLSLIEAIVALALTGLLLAGVIPGMLMSVNSSGRNQDQAEATARLTSVIERMKALATKPGFYVPCATAAQVKAALLADPGGSVGAATFDVPSAVTYWDGSGYSPSCPPADLGAQLVPLRITVGVGPDAGVADGIVVVRNPRAVAP